MAKRRIALAGVAALSAAFGALWLSRVRPPRAWIPGGLTDRGRALGGLGVRVGTATVSTRARQVFASAERRAELDEALQMRTAEQVAATLGNMKGAMMKLGQMASYLDDGLPAHLRDALKELQQDAPPMSAELAAGVVREELGGDPEAVFAEWDPRPIAAASIGQVHRAITKDGQAVAVKVQYPGVGDAIAADLQATDVISNAVRLIYPNMDAKAMAAEIRARLVEELDYRLEAKNQERFADYWAGHPTIHIPRVRLDLSTSRVLTTELAEGVRFDVVEQEWDQEQRDLAAETIFRFVFGSLYRLHAFNGDPHPGNYLFRPDGQVTFLDFGLVKQFTAEEVELFEDLVTAMVLERDSQLLRKVMGRGHLMAEGAPLTDHDLYEYMAHFYELVLHDREQSWTPEYASETVRQLFDRGSAMAPHATGGGSTFVIIQRINLGLYALFGRLHASANWHRIAREIWPMVEGEPSTPMGEGEAAWRRQREAATGLSS